MADELSRKPTHNDPIDAAALKQILLDARTYNDFDETRPVPAETLKRLYDTVRMGPTSANSSPARFLFLTTPEAKARLEPHLSEGNRAKTMKAPVTVVVAWDTEFYERHNRIDQASLSILGRVCGLNRYRLLTQGIASEA